MVEIFGENTEVDALYLEDVPALHLAEGDWLSQGSCFQGTMDDARTIISDMASALMYLRTMSIRHNNIRPSCILYSREIGAKLTDFDDATRNGEPATLSGTAWYVPPEWMAIGERRESGDVWALGIIMLYLMRRIPLPESERQVKAWDIKQLRGREAGRGAARRLMSRWLQIVRHEVEKLKDFQDEAKWMAETTQRMLHPVVSLRITGSELAMMLAEDDVARGQWGGR